MTNKEMGILDLVLVLAKHRILIIVLCFLAVAGSVIYALLAPQYWESVATLKPVSESDALGGFGSSLLEMVGGGLISTPASELSKDFINIMKRREFREEVVRRFNLIPYYKISEADSSKAMALAIRALLAETVNLALDEENGLVILRVETKSKVLSRDIARYYLDYLEKFNLQNRMSKGRQKREFLQKQVNKTMLEVDSLALAMRDFQASNQSIAIDEQTQSLVNLYSNSASELIKAQMEYELEKTQYGADSPILKKSAYKIDLLQQQIKSLEGGKQGINPKYIIQIDKIPDLSMRYAQLMINAEIKKKVLEYLYPQFELAKLEELKDLPTFEVYDQPQLAGMRSRPKRALIVVFTTLAVFMLSCVVVLIWEGLFRQNKAKLDEIVAALKGRG
ncbi:MAG TPA: Wzz/FepE/Etk N-terminal domain-containing protein [Candidatus Cloacimonas sp.]|nr:Wzz/FepE/Etk N-terminal domain-containing protein [Candidatus Cloacimonas sp.]